MHSHTQEENRTRHKWVPINKLQERFKSLEEGQSHSFERASTVMVKSGYSRDKLSGVLTG